MATERCKNDSEVETRSLGLPGLEGTTGVWMIMVENELCSTWSSGGGAIRVAEAASDTSREENGTVSDITISNSSAETVAAGEDGSIDIVDIDSRTPTEAFEVVHKLSVGQLTPDGKKLLFGGHDGYGGPFAGIALSEDGKELASASSDGSIRV
ncbi:WD40/YVTN repeat containing protein [Gracilaria domingensis]|nr:WD40/YVTN repeat containing protein [Gracilaria domingensis]